VREMGDVVGWWGRRRKRQTMRACIDTVHKLNVVKECQGGRAGTGACGLCVAHRVVLQPRKSILERERERERANRSAYKHGFLSQCNEIRCKKWPNKNI
jgi:hypothetical protein